MDCSCVIGKRRQSFLKRQCRLILRPIDNLEGHSPLEHFGLERGSVFSPVRCFADTETSFLVLLLEGIVGGKRTAYALVHHGEAVVRERLIIHRVPTKKPAGVTPSAFSCDCRL